MNLMLLLKLSCECEFVDVSFSCVQYHRMKSLFEKTRQTHTAMIQKVRDAFQHRDDMRIQMEEAFTAKEAVSAATDRTVNVTLVVQCMFLLSISMLQPLFKCL